MIKTRTNISNKLGLHARASAKLTKLAASFASEIWMSKGERRVNAKSIMGVMMLQDELLISGVKHWITERHYNAEWALATQYEIIARQFDDMEDEYLRERKADLEQVVERILRYMRGVASPMQPAAQAGSSRK